MTEYTPEQIRAERQRRKWTQRKFADMIGVTPVSVSKWETGLTEPSYNHMQRINEVFDHGADRDRVAELEADVSRLSGELDQLAAVVAELAQELRRAMRTHVESLEADATPDERDAGRADRPDTESQP